MIKLEIFTDCLKAYDSGKMFALGVPEQEQAIQHRCKEVAEFKETNFVILRHNTPLNPTTIEI